MRINSFLNTTEQKVLSKTHNIWLGISLGNKYFNYEHLEDYIKSCLKLSKDKLLIIVADEPQAINYEVFEKMKPEVAKRKAIRNGEKIYNTVTTIIKQLQPEQQTKIILIKWDSLSKTSWYKERLDIFSKEFEVNSNFKNKLIEIVKQNMGERLEKLTGGEIIQLSKYVLQELPIFMGAISFENTIYDLHIYPGLSLMDNFILKLQKSFLLNGKIKITYPIAIAEAYAK